MLDNVERIMGVIIDSIPGDAGYIGNGQFIRKGGELLQACHGCGCGNCIWKHSEKVAVVSGIG